MATKKQYTRLAELKVQKKEIEKEVKELEKKIMDKNPKDVVETEFGKLQLKGRTKYDVETYDVYKQIIRGFKVKKETFLKHCTISTTNIKKMIGEVGLQKLQESGSVQEKPKTFYYSLTANKGD